MNQRTRSASPLSEELRQRLFDAYKRLHGHPELSMRETATAAFIAERMTELGFEVHRCGGTGLIAILRNGRGPVVAYRSDMDGLPVTEMTGLDYASSHVHQVDDRRVPVMHACGHDMHMTWALGVAELLMSAQNRWCGTAEFIFQPGEETGQGALAMVGDGLWDIAPRPDVLLAQHVAPRPVGTMTFTPGVALATSDTFTIRINGRGGHGSTPEVTIDPIVIAAHLIVRLQTLVSREIGPEHPAVVTVGSIHAGQANNVIPDSAELSGSIRTFDEPTRQHLLTGLSRIALAESAAAGAPPPTVEVNAQFPLTVNDPAVIADLMNCLAEEFDTALIEAVPPLMGSEDISHLTTAGSIPLAYWFVGGGSAIPPTDGDAPGNHSPRFAPEPHPTIDLGTRAGLTAMLSRLGTPTTADASVGHHR